MRRAVAALSLAGACNGLTEEYVRNNGQLLWSSFKNEFSKSYASGEEGMRYGVFMQNMAQAARDEQANPNATFGATEFSDLSADEFKVYHSLSFPEREDTPATFSAEEVRNALAGSVDWRTKGAVTKVKNQKQCGSCWAFSSTGGIEGQWFLAGNPLTLLSEQELVACDTYKDNTGADQGCKGGLMDRAYNWIVKDQKGLIVGESTYPYTDGGGKTSKCRSDLKYMAPAAQITGHTMIAKSESQMATYVTSTGPLPIGVDAQSVWQSYKGGIVSNCNGKNLDHGVLIVGYSPDYWIVKNSWGSSWGESGYIRLKYGTNQCGLTNSATAAIASTGSLPPPPPPGPPTPMPPATPPPPPACGFTDCSACSKYCGSSSRCSSGSSGFTCTCPNSPSKNCCNDC